MQNSVSARPKNFGTTTIAAATILLSMAISAAVAPAAAGKSGPQAAQRGAVMDTKVRSATGTVTRDHRGSTSRGGVTVTDGKPRARGGGLCAGWFC